MAASRTSSRDEQAQQDQRTNQNQNQAQTQNRNQTQDQQQQGTQSNREAGGSVRDSQRGIQTTNEPVRGGVTRRGTSPVSGYGANSPFSLMRRMAEDMDRIFEDFGFGPSLGIAPLLTPSFGQGRGLSSAQRGTWAPQLETFRRGDNLVVRADLPGLRKEDVNVEVDDGMLTISGQRSEEQVEDRDDYYRSERSYGQFFRALPLPEGVTGDACEATFKDGVLEVTLPLPKQPERKARRVEVRS
jgi:HSP20 family protein